MMTPTDVSTSLPAPAAAGLPRRLDVKGVVAYVVLSYGLAWVVALPLWLGKVSRTSGGGVLVSAAMMFTPALSVLLCLGLFGRPKDAKASLGLRLRAPGRRVLPALLAAYFLPVAAVLVAVGIAAASGQLTLDLKDFSHYRKLLSAVPQAEQILTRIPVQLLVALDIFKVFLLAPINCIPTFGEELGWRGYLLPKLLPLGPWRALLASGVIWSLWHAPLILLGHNYPEYPVAGLAFMTVFCVLAGCFVGWLRLSTGSVWPSVLAHAVINAWAGLPVLLMKDGAPFNSLTASFAGVPGWIALAALVGGLVALKKLPVREAPDAAAEAHG